MQNKAINAIEKNDEYKISNNVCFFDTKVLFGFILINNLN